MSTSIYDYLVVKQTGGGFSAAEARVGKTYVKFNNLTAAELHYPEYVRLLIGKDGTTLVIQPSDREDPNSVPFMCGRTADDLNGKKKWICITNRMLGRIIHEKAHWQDVGKGTAPKRFYAVPWADQNALIFDLLKPVPPRMRSSNLTADDILSTYEKAAKALYPVPAGVYQGVIDASFTPVNE